MKDSICSIAIWFWSPFFLFFGKIFRLDSDLYECDFYFVEMFSITCMLDERFDFYSFCSIETWVWIRFFFFFSFAEDFWFWAGFMWMRFYFVEIFFLRCGFLMKGSIFIRFVQLLLDFEFPPFFFFCVRFLNFRTWKWWKNRIFFKDFVWTILYFRDRVFPQNYWGTRRYRLALTCKNRFIRESWYKLANLGYDLLLFRAVSKRFLQFFYFVLFYFFLFGDNEWVIELLGLVFR